MGEKDASRWRVGLALGAIAAVAVAVGLAAAHDGSDRPARVLEKREALPPRAEPRSVLVPPSMVVVPAADLEMGSSDHEIAAASDLCRAESGRCTAETQERERRIRRVRVSAFLLDRTERTNAEVAAWLSSSTSLRIDQDRWAWLGDLRVVDLGAESSTLRADHGKVVVARPELAGSPAVYITHGGARAFCKSRGLDLPTEAQWERAARGVEGRRFPWGDAVPGCEQAVFARVKSRACASVGLGALPVSTELLDRTPEGVLHLGGNASEWVLDRYADYAPCSGTCVDPVVAPTEDDHELRVVRGGSALLGASTMRGAARGRWPADSANPGTGFRCARAR